MPSLFEVMLVLVSFLSGIAGPFVVMLCLASKLCDSLKRRREFCFRAVGWHYHGQQQRRPDGATVFVIVMEPDDGWQPPETSLEKPEENAA